MTPEGKILKEILKYLKDSKVPHWRLNSSNGTYGMPDIIGIHPLNGKFIGIEVKAEDGKPSEVQELTGKYIIDNKGIHVFAKSIQDVAIALWGEYY